MIPEELKVKNGNDILKEVYEELGLPSTKVKHMFNVWLRYLEYIADETDQAMIRLPHIGSLMYNIRKSTSKRLSLKNRRLKRLKTAKITKDANGHTITCHSATMPIHLIYGIGRRNFKKEGYPFFTVDDCVNNQNSKFFDEDFKYSGNYRLKNKILK